MVDEKGKAEEAKRPKKLSKTFEGNVLVITEGITGKVLKFDVAKLNETVQNFLIKHGASQKVGDAAAGREGEEAVEAMTKVWEALLKGDVTVRMPAAEKVSKKSLADKVSAMPDGKEKEAAKALLAKLGITV